MKIIRSFLAGSSSTIPDCENRYSLNQLQKFESVLQQNNRSLQSATSIFEFGCGVGRLLRLISRLLPGVRISGCDVLPASLDACRRAVPHAHLWRNQAQPPLDCVGEQFDLIYSYSVFTHLSEPNHIAWLRELARLLKPGGVMLHTTKSYAFVRRAALFSPQSLTKYKLSGSVDDVVSGACPYHYIVDNPALPEYGLTIISKEYVRSKWLGYSGLDFLDYHEGAIEANPEGCHDIILLGKAPR